MREIGREINEALTMRQVLDYYQIEVNNTGFAHCPFHQGDRTASLKVYDHSYYCFGCGQGGDIISFVRSMNNCDFMVACTLLDHSFSLGIIGRERSFSEYRTAEKKRLERIKADRAAQAALDYHEKQYQVLSAYYRWLRSQPPSEAVQFDLDYLDRLLSRDRLIDFDATARIAALKSKHEGGEALLE